MSLDDSLHLRQDPRHPGRTPVGALGEHPLHVDTQMRAAVAQRAETKPVISRHSGARPEVLLCLWTVKPHGLALSSAMYIDQSRAARQHQRLHWQVVGKRISKLLASHDVN